MAKNRIVAAVELGSSKVATLIAQVVTDPTTFEVSINIVGVAAVPSRGVKKGQIVDIEETVEVAIASIEAAERMAGYNLDSAYIAVSGAHMASQNSHGVVAVSDPDGEITQDEVDRVIEGASAVSLPSAREVIHVVPREFIVDGEAGVKDAIGMSGVRLEVDTHIITASFAAIKNLRKAAKEVGIETEGLVFSALASAEAILSDSAKKDKKTKEEGDTLDLESLGVPEVKNVSKRTLVDGIIRPRLNEIFTMVRLELDKADVANRVPSGVVVTGGGAETVGIEDAARRMLSLPVRIGKPKGVGGLIDDVITPSFATCVGLILYGANEPGKEGLTSIGKRIKLPTKGIAGKLVEAIEKLVPLV